MQVIISRLEKGAREARGTAVIVDVYRAFSCTALLFSLGVESVILMGSPEEALAYKKKDPQVLLAGEVGGLPIAGFDLPNSPSFVLSREPGYFKGRRVVQRTSAGVQGALLALERAQRVFLASYLNARATARAIEALSPKRAHIVAMGRNMLDPSPEDEWCARYLKHLLGAGPYSHLVALREILWSPETQKFLRGDKAHYPPEDPLICLQMDLLDLLLVARKEKGLVVVRSQDCSPSKGLGQIFGEKAAGCP